MSFLKPITLLLLALLSASLTRADGQIKITDPRDKTPVTWMTCIHGTAPEGTELWPVVHPKNTSNYHVQPRLTVKDGHFSGIVYIAKNVPRRYTGQVFELLILGNPKSQLHENDILPYYPDAQMQSSMVELVRQDGPSIGCEATVETEGHPTITPPVKPAEPEQRPEAGPGRVVILEDLTLELRRQWRILAAFVLALFALFMVLHECVDEINAALCAWLAAFWRWLVAAALAFWSSLCALCSRTWTWSTAKTHDLWFHSRHGESLRPWFLQFLKAPLLVMCFLLALYADTPAIVLGLELILREQKANPTATIGASLIAPVEPRAGQTEPAPPPPPSGVRMWIGRLAILAARVATQSLLPMALGLASLQAALGIILFQQMSTEDVLAAKVSVLLSKRTLLASTFFLLDLGLAAVAAYRSYELSPPQVPWIIPVGIAFVLGLVIPPVMTYCGYFMLEALADCCAPIIALIVNGLVMLAGFLAVAGWTFILLTAFAACAATFAVFFAFRWIFGAFITLAKLMGQAIRILYDAVENALKAIPIFERPTPRRVAWAGLALLALVVAAIGMTGCTAPALSPINTTAISHDSSAPYTVWAFCSDTSLSLLPEEFERLKVVWQDTVRSQVGPNDLVWLVPIGTHLPPATLFEIPPEGGTRSQHTDAGAVELAKQKLITAIANLKQSAMRTELKDPVESSLALLRSHEAAQLRVLLIGSDFIQDVDGHVPDLDPRIEASAAGVQVEMYVAQPLARYLEKMHITRYDLVEAVKTKWTTAFSRLGARSAGSAPLDAIPVVRAVPAPAERQAE